MSARSARSTPSRSRTDTKRSLTLPPSRPPSRPENRLGRRVIKVLLILAAIPVALALLYREVPPPVTPLMLIRLVQGEGLTKTWKPLDAISPNLPLAVMAGEDSGFCRHHGFEWGALNNALNTYVDTLTDEDSGGPLLGGSTISMQTSKNVFLWPGRDVVRKGLEAGLTVILEGIWGKRRIMEVYLNVIEWGHGLYGAEAAAQYYFHKPAAQLTHREAAALAAVLPSPLRWSPVEPEGFVARHINTIAARMDQIQISKDRLCP